MRTPCNRRLSAFRGVLSSVAALSPLAVLTAAMCSVTGCGGPKAAPADPRPEVEVASVLQKDVPIVSEWVATLDGYVNAQIQPQVSGYVIRQTYKEGSLVRQGQILFQIDPRPFQALLDQAQGPIAGVNLARLQRASEGTHHSTGGCRNDVVDGGGVRLLEFRGPEPETELPGTLTIQK
jgi:multidrug efflux pump subunit AcrA (membrane-fusion protein)